MLKVYSLARFVRHHFVNESCDVYASPRSSYQQSQPGDLIRNQMFEDDRWSKDVFPVGVIVWDDHSNDSIGVLWSSDPDR